LGKNYTDGLLTLDEYLLAAKEVLEVPQY